MSALRPCSSYSSLCFSPVPSSTQDSSCDDQLAYMSYSDSACSVSRNHSPAIPSDTSSSQYPMAQTVMGPQESEHQLIMPVVSLPARRSFTEKGKNIAKLKLLFAGAAGSGRSSLIQTILKYCSDIVHVDESPVVTETGISEIYASSKPYPFWWSSDDTDPHFGQSSSVLSSDVIDRNICFVDISESSDGIDSAVQYLESLFERTAQIVNVSSSLSLPVLSSPSLPHVDACIYLVEGCLSQLDIEHIETLSNFLPVMPVLSKIDSSTTCRGELKLDLIRQLKESGINPFLFEESFDSLVSNAAIKLDSCLPFTVSTVNDKEMEMDASILMDPNYLPPLIPSGLNMMIERLISEESASWMRHLAAQKFLRWREKKALSMTLTRLNAGPVEATNPKIHLPDSFFSRADHGITLEQKLAQTRLARWAVNLEQSLSQEREQRDQFLALHRGSQEDFSISDQWVIERLESGCLAQTNEGGEFNRKLTGRERFGAQFINRGFLPIAHKSSIQDRDPLGIYTFEYKVELVFWRLLGTVIGVGVVTGWAVGHASTVFSMKLKG